MIQIPDNTLFFYGRRNLKPKIQDVSLAYLNNNYTIDMKFTRKKCVLLETCLQLSNEDILLVICALFCVNIGRIAQDFGQKRSL